MLPFPLLSPNFSSVITLLLQFELRAESGETGTLCENNYNLGSNNGKPGVGTQRAGCLVPPRLIG